MKGTSRSRAHQALMRKGPLRKTKPRGRKRPNMVEDVTKANRVGTPLIMLIIIRGPIKSDKFM